MAYIEKEPIVELIAKGLNNPDKTKAFGHDAIEILTEIEYAPTADVAEVKHGEWQATEAYPHWLCCSVCHRKYVPNDKWIDEYNMPTNYCPNCGAKMDGGKE